MAKIENPQPSDQKGSADDGGIRHGSNEQIFGANGQVLRHGLSEFFLVFRNSHLQCATELILKTGKAITVFGSTVFLRVKQRRKKCRTFSSNSAPRSPRSEQMQMKLFLAGVAALSVLTEPNPTHTAHTGTPRGA